MLRKLRAAEIAAHRKPGSAGLVAVSKTIETERIVPIIEAGQTHFGENRVQEAQSKWPALKARHPGLTLHLIGPLQSNKVRDAVALFDVIETLDRDKIADLVADEMARTGRRPECFVQINIGREPQKSGAPPDDADRFIAYCRDRAGLDLVGLMCVPPQDQPPDGYFRQLAEIAGRNGLSRLSMGMSADFEAAIQAGSTEVRLGTAIFGRRT